jgi:hypothetical protein
MPHNFRVLIAHICIRSPCLRLQEKELAEEKVYFNKEDEKLLRKLLTKIKGHADKDTSAAAPAASVEKQRLMAIVSKYGVSDADIEALLAWRHSHDF